MMNTKDSKTLRSGPTTDEQESTTHPVSGIIATINIPYSTRPQIDYPGINCTRKEAFTVQGAVAIIAPRITLNKPMMELSVLWKGL